MIYLEDKNIAGFIEKNADRLEISEIIIASDERENEKSISVTLENGELYYTVWDGDTRKERVPFDISEAWSLFVDLYETHIGDGISDDDFHEDIDFEVKCEESDDALRSAFEKFISTCINDGAPDLSEYELDELFEDILEIVSDRGIKVYRPMVFYENGQEVHTEYPYEDGVDVRSYFI